MTPRQDMDPVTDPRFIYSDDANVIAYRLGIVETGVDALDKKLDKIINEYPTHSTLSLILDPMREELKELKTKYEKEKEDKVKNQQQMKLATFAAIISPVMTIVVGIIAVSMFGGSSING